jgi:hypothetical protein
MRSSCTRPDATFSSPSPSGPSACTSDQAVFRTSRDPAGSAIVMATDPLFSPGLVVSIVRWPAEKPTLVFSATFTSDLLALLTGSTCTTVSGRSLAVTRTRAPAVVKVAVIGSGVSNAGMAIPS